MKKSIQVTSVLCFLLVFAANVAVDQACFAMPCLIQDTDSKPENAAPANETPQQEPEQDTKPEAKPSDEPSDPSAETPTPDSDPSGEKGKEHEKDQSPEKENAPEENQERRGARENNRSERNNDESRASSFFRGLARDEHRDKSKRSREFVELFKPLVVSAEASTVKVLNGDRLVSLGTVVGRDGLVLTKASELRGELNCGLPNGDKVPAVVVGIHQETDLALLKIARDDLNPIHWGSDDVPIVGQWLAAPILNRTNEVHTGVVSVNVRKIPPSSPYLGIGPPTQGGADIVGAKIDTVQPNTPADDADLMVGDIITKIDDVEIKNWDDLRRTLGQYDPKDEITLTVLRGQEELKIKAVLGERERLERGTVPQQDRGTMQNNMGSQPSQRRKDFPMAFQHDLMLNKTTCGGPIVNLNGQVVGINIARAGRVDSLALPVNTVLPVIELLKSGELSPTKINQARLVQIDAELAEVVKKIETLPETQSLDIKLQIEKARREEVEKSIAEKKKEMQELENRLKVIGLKEEGYEKQVKSIKSEQNTLSKRKFSLEKEQKGLATGVN